MANKQTSKEVYFLYLSIKTKRAAARTAERARQCEYYLSVKIWKLFHSLPAKLAVLVERQDNWSCEAERATLTASSYHRTKASNCEA